MISFEKAKLLIRKNIKQLPPQKVDLMDSIGCLIASDIFAKSPVPMFDSSAVDGFAVNISDLTQASKSNPVKLKIKNTIQAGDTRKYILKPHLAFKIFTGAIVPENVNAILMKEHVVEEDGYVIITTIPRIGENIRKAGDEFSVGDLMLKKNTLITPPVVAMLASLGVIKVDVIPKPRISIIVTGNELKGYNQELELGQIYDSNSPALFAALKSIGITPVFVKTVGDDINVITRTLKKAELVSDVIITAGGVSVGEFDLVRESAKLLGFKEIFWKVAIKPGKPNFFAVKGKKLFFGLPGNPVAAIVSFNNLVKYAIALLMGKKFGDKEKIKARLLTDLTKKEGRLEFVRGYISKNKFGEYVVAPTKGQESHMLGGLVKANCLIKFPRIENFLPAGSEVEIISLDWFKI